MNFEYIWLLKMSFNRGYIRDEFVICVIWSFLEVKNVLWWNLLDKLKLEDVLELEDVVYKIYSESMYRRIEFMELERDGWWGEE